MPLAKRIIPVLLYDSMGNLVKPKSFGAHRRIGTLRQQARIYAKRGVDELVILDITAGEIDFELIRIIAEEQFTPLAYGGGIKDISQIREILKAGADKVVLNRELFNIGQQASDMFGNSTIVGKIDSDTENLEEWVRKAEKFCGELIIIDKKLDGTLGGLNMEKAIPSKVPLVIGGGLKDEEDCFKALSNKNVSAVCGGAIFSFTQHTPGTLAEYCKSKGILLR